MKTFTFKTSIISKNRIGECFHTGIIVKLNNGVKYLFGNYKGESLVIFCPELNKDFEVCINESVILDNISIKIEVNDDCIRFHYKENLNEYYSLMYEETLQDYIDKYGIF